MHHTPIYLDYNATTPILPEVVDAMIPYLREHFGNPSSGHVYGRRAAQAIEHARAQVAELLGCQPEELIFTGGGTEANNIAIRGVLGASERRGNIVTSTIEHPATAQPCAWLEQNGTTVNRIQVDQHGQICVDQAIQATTNTTTLLTVMHSNNETGVLQPIRELADHARTVGAFVHTDAAQSLGKVAVNVDDLSVDLLSVAGHKLYGPKGVGALYIRQGTPVSAVLLGAGHERGVRPGTENVASIVGLGVACAIAHRDLDVIGSQMQRLRDELWARLVAEIPGLKLNGHPEKRLPNTLNIRFPGISGEAILRGAPEVAASTGSACHAGQTTASPVILAMGIPADEALGSVRLTLGRNTSHDDIALAAVALHRSYCASSP